MAIVPMKLVTVFGPVGDFDHAVHSYIINRQFHPEYAFEMLKEQDIAGLLTFKMNNPYSEILGLAQQISDDMNYELDYSDFDEKKTEPDAVLTYLKDLSGKYNELTAQKEALERLFDDNNQIIKPLEHLRGFVADLNEFFSFSFVKFRFGRMPRETYEIFSLHIDARPDVFFIPTSIERHYVYGMYFTPRNYEETVDMYFASLHFEQIQISNRVKGTASEAIAALSRENNEIKVKLSFIESSIDRLKAENRIQFLSNYSYARYMNDSYGFRGYAAHSVESFFMLGWVPEDELPGFLEKIDLDPHVNYVVDEPNEEIKIKPPIKLKNNIFSRAFQPFVEMYGLPAHNEMDPTFLISVTYTLLFGIMFGDVGQGALLILLGILLYKWKGMWLGRIIAYAGVSAVIFGFVYGSVFGFEDKLPGFKVLESSANTNRILLIAIGIGITIISLSMILNIANGIRQKNYEKAIFSQNGAAGLLLYLSAVYAVVQLMMYSVNILTGHYVLFLIIIPLILIFLRHPLGKLLSREPDWRPESIGNFIIENFFELFEVCLSYITNTISFLRVGAFAISHPGMMLVVFLLAGPHDNPNILVVIIGNLVVMAIEGLLVGIQVLRLEFYEIFGRFYSGEGVQYKPVIIDYKSRNL